MRYEPSRSMGIFIGAVVAANSREYSRWHVLESHDRLARRQIDEPCRFFLSPPVALPLYLSPSLALATRPSPVTGL